MSTEEPSSFLYCTASFRERLPLHMRLNFKVLDEMMKKLASSAKRRLTMVSPYLSPAGFQLFREPFIQAATAGAWIRLITGDLKNRGGLNWKSVNGVLGKAGDPLLRERLRVLTSKEHFCPLLHAKLIVVDGNAGYLGSANLSASGLTHNFEIGVSQARRQAAAIEQVIDYWESCEDLVDRTGEFR